MIEITRPAFKIHTATVIKTARPRGGEGRPGRRTGAEDAGAAAQERGPPTSGRAAGAIQRGRACLLTECCWGGWPSGGKQNQSLNLRLMLYAQYLLKVDHKLKCKTLNYKSRGHLLDTG